MSHIVKSVFSNGIKVLVFFHTLLLQNALVAQSESNQYLNKFTFLNTLNGLSSDFVNQVIKDHKGYLWIATQNGLNRYDGVHLKTYYHDSLDQNSLCSNLISSIFMDSKNRLWIGTAESGINILDLETYRFSAYHTNDTVPGSLKKYLQITSFYEDSRHRIWITTWGSGLYLFDESKKNFIQFANDVNKPSSIFCNKVKSIQEDNKGRFWVGLWAESPIDTLGLQLFNPELQSFTNYHHYFSSELKLPTDYKLNSIFKFIHCLYLDKVRNVLWIGGYEGLARISLSENSYQTFFHKSDTGKTKIQGRLNIRHITMTKNNELVLSTQDNGIVILSEDLNNLALIEADASTESALSSNVIRNTLIDENNQWFVSTQGGGLQISIPGQNEFSFIHKRKMAISSNKNVGINAIGKQNGKLYFGTSFGLLSGDGSFADLQYTNLRGQTKEMNVVHLFQDHHETTMFIATNINLFEMEQNGTLDSISTFSKIGFNAFGNAYDILKWNNDTIFVVGEFSGVHLYNRKSKFRKKLDNKDYNLGFWNFVEKLDNENVLIGYKAGILKYNLVTDSIQHAFTKSIPSHVMPGWTCRNIISDQDHRFWFTCDSSLGRLDLLNQTYKFYPLLLNHLLIPLTCIEQDDHGNLWVSGEYDIFHFDTTTKRYTRIQSHLIKTTYPNGRDTYLDDNTGILYVASPEGLKLVDTKLFYNDRTLHSIKITDIFLNNESNVKDRVENGILKLNHDQNTLAIHFTNFDYEQNRNYTLEYRIDPIQKTWTVVPHNQIIELNNIKSGQYKIQVKYKHLDEGHPTSAYLEVDIALPFWQTIWFISAVILCSVMAIRALVIYNVTRLKQRNLELENKVSERTLELQRQKKESEDLLLNILPENIVEELKNKGYTEARYHDNVTVLFSDFVNFTGISSTMEPSEVVMEIDRCFKAFDNIIEKYGLEKIKTIGDCYMAVGGLTSASEQETINTIRAAQEFIKYIDESKSLFKIRVGIHTGSVIAGVVGFKKFAYDIWGDTVNIASRMESNGIPMRINISKDTYKQIQSDYTCEYRGKIETKNTGELEMYLIVPSSTI